MSDLLAAYAAETALCDAVIAAAPSLDATATGRHLLAALDHRAPDRGDRSAPRPHRPAPRAGRRRGRRGASATLIHPSAYYRAWQPRADSASWPQAASMPRPRVSRTVTLTFRSLEHVDEDAGCAPATTPPPRSPASGSAGSGSRGRPAGERSARATSPAPRCRSPGRSSPTRSTSRRWVAERHAAIASSSTASGYRSFGGTSCERSSSFAAWKLTASPTCGCASVRCSMPGTSPTVETVTCRAPRPNACGSVSRAMRGEHVALVRERLAHAHEHHVGEALRRRVGKLRRLTPGPHDLRRDLSRRQVVATDPSVPVAQNVHPIAHPDCDDTHTVTRSR